MTDIDGYCSIDGRKLFLEWKSSTGNVPEKQMEALMALSMGALVLVAWGDPKEMLPKEFYTIKEGVKSDVVSEESAPVEFDRIIKEWAGVEGDSGLKKMFQKKGKIPQTNWPKMAG